MSDLVRAAATVIVVRDAEAGIEVLLLSRNPDIGGAHYGGALVFPGGAVEAQDSHAAWADCADSSDDGGPRFEDSLGSFDAYRIAAIRECFEEAGITLGTSNPIASADSRYTSGEKPFFDLCQNRRLNLADVVYTSHWLTPVGRPKRFDTRFFTAELPKGQVIRHDGVEALAHTWFKPTDALSAFYQGEVTLWPPTQYSLLMLAEFQEVADLMTFLRSRSASRIPSTFPRLDEKKRPIFPWSKNY